MWQVGGRPKGAIVECFVEVCRRRGLKVNAVLGGEEGLEYEICIDGMP